jgi:type VI secretion system protein ImpM
VPLGPLTPADKERIAMAWPATASDLHGSPGWYGKLAGLGDFAQRRLPTAWVATCDAWLSEAMRSGHEVLGERWLDVYLTAPLLRFAWAPEVIDAHWWFGLLMPSCDSVGRYFPLLIAQSRTRPPEDRIALDHLELWFDHLGQAAMQTLHGGSRSVDDLEATLQEAPPWPTPTRGPAPTAPRNADDAHLRLTRAAPLSQWIQALAAQALTARLAGCSVWWRSSETGADDRVDIVHGLPRNEQLVGLLAGS